MPDREEVLGALYGAYRLARIDPAGMTYFNLSFEGFWRSFFAAVLVAPAYAVAHNWTAVLQTAVFLAVVVLGPILAQVLATFLVTLTTGAILAYQWFVIKTALQTTGGIALMLLLVDLVVTSTINLGAERLL